MSNSFRASRDIIIRTERFTEAICFYSTVIGLAVVHQGDTLVGYDAGAFVLYVEKGPAHGPVFDFYVSDLQDAKRDLTAAGCSIVEEDPSVPRCYVKDPYGLVFNIEQRALPAAGA
ncbi:MAG TPA: VOC family protein [Steroidobacteraceae bacterium]